MPEGEFKKLLDGISIGNTGEYQVNISDEDRIVQKSHLERFMRIQSLIEVQWCKLISVK